MEFRKIAWILLIILVAACVMGIVGAAISGVVSVWTLILANLTAIALAVMIIIDKYL